MEKGKARLFGFGPPDQSARPAQRNAGHAYRMEKNLSKKARSNVVTRDELGPPNIISLVQMNELLEGYGVVGMKRTSAIEFLHGLVREFRQDMRDSASQNRKNARKALTDAAKWLSAAGKAVRGSGMIGSEIIRHDASGLSEMFSLTWLSQLLPDHQLLPSPPVQSRSMRPRHGSSRMDGDAQQAAYYLLQSEGQAIIAGAISQIASMLAASIDSSKQKGGRKTILHRHFFLLNLAVLWEEKLGRDCRATTGQTFRDFCEVVFDYVGWPTRGLKRAIDKAVSDYHNRSYRN